VGASPAPRFITDIPAQRPDGTWGRRTEYLAAPGVRSARLRGALWGVRLFRARHRAAGAITTGAGPGVVLAVLQCLPGVRRVPHLMVDCLWYRERTPLRRALARAKFALLRRSVTAFAVWASVEVEDYARALGLPREKLVFVPYHHTLSRYRFAVADQGYVFAGGDGDRDYGTLIAAARGLEAPVRIATRRREWHRAELPPNVTITALDPEDFRQAMAGARVVVVPMQAGLLHAGGQQTYLNAMAMGKPVIVCDERGAPDYVTDGVTGVICPAGDAAALRRALERLLADAALREALGRRAAAEVEARDLTTEGCMRRVVGVIDDRRPRAESGGRTVMTGMSREK
jgi:glycosyltransferase involved in cell wall biosynthesis